MAGSSGGFFSGWLSSVAAAFDFHPVVGVAWAVVSAPFALVGGAIELGYNVVKSIANAVGGAADGAAKVAENGAGSVAQVAGKGAEVAKSVAQSTATNSAVVAKAAEKVASSPDLGVVFGQFTTAGLGYADVALTDEQRKQPQAKKQESKQQPKTVSPDQEKVTTPAKPRGAQVPLALAHLADPSQKKENGSRRGTSSPVPDAPHFADEPVFGQNQGFGSQMIGGIGGDNDFLKEARAAARAAASEVNGMENTTGSKGRAPTTTKTNPSIQQTTDNTRG